jgi:hypothetical protein
MLKSKMYPNLFASGAAATARTRPDRDKVLAESDAKAKARAIKTAKLRELRLAKEEADRVAKEAAPAKKSPKQRKSRLQRD